MGIKAAALLILSLIPFISLAHVPDINDENGVVSFAGQNLQDDLCLWNCSRSRLEVFIKTKDLFGFYTFIRQDSLRKKGVPVYYSENGKTVKKILKTSNIHYYELEDIGSTIDNHKQEDYRILLRIEENKNRNKQTFYIEYISDTAAGSFYFNSDMTKQDNKNCTYVILKKEWKESHNKTAYESEKTPEMSPLEVYQQSLRPKRSLNSVLLFPTTKYIEIYLVYERSTFLEFKSSIETITKWSLDLINEVDTIYSQHNIRVVLDGIEIWNEKDKVDFKGKDKKSTLHAFSNYIGKNIKHPDHVHLFTSRNLGLLNGIAYVSAMCQFYHSTGWTKYSSVYTIFMIGKTLAHEIGHNLGMRHHTPGDENCPCPADYCIMNSRGLWTPQRFFSECNLRIMADYINSERGSCLSNVPDIIQNIEATCGNNVLEVGEECDCGTAYFCINPCCNAATCKLTEGSECAHGYCCHRCKIANKATICRQVESAECDLLDYCDGVTTECKNYLHVNGKTCDQERGICYGGKCLSHNEQCKALWGGEAVGANPECYGQVNRLGKWYGHCEKTLNGNEATYTPCRQEDEECGLLQCTNTGEEPILGKEWKKRKIVNIYHNGAKYECKIGYADSGRQRREYGKFWL